MNNYYLSKAAIIILLLVFPISGRGLDLSSSVVHVYVNGIGMAVPVYYIPGMEGGWYHFRHETRALRISIKWPTMYPFIDPGDDSPTEFRYRSKIDILLDPAPAASDAERHTILKKISSHWLIGRHRETREFGLMKFSRTNPLAHNESGWVGGIDDGDVYVYPSLDKMVTFIRCSPDFEPGSSDDVTAVRRPKVTRALVPWCEQNFFMPRLNLRLTLSYRRTQLKQWREIQERVVKLIRSFLIPDPVSLSTPRKSVPS